MSNNIEAKVVATTPRTMRKSRRSAARLMSSRPSINSCNFLLALFVDL